MLSALDRGQHDTFMKLWDQTVPAGIRYRQVVIAATAPLLATSQAAHAPLPVKSDPTAQKLLFYVQILFAVQPFVTNDLVRRQRRKRLFFSIRRLMPPRPQGLDPNVTMNRFRAFLETRGALLSKTAEFLPYYALPFVSDLRHHPTFQAFFAVRVLRGFLASHRY
jgi:hypothetical protein